jgi:hypothetical protein
MMLAAPRWIVVLVGAEVRAGELISAVAQMTLASTEEFRT